MLQNRTVSSPLTVTSPPDLANSLGRTLTHERLQVVRHTFSLPNSLRSFLIFLLMLIVIFGALFAHLLLSMTIHQNELELARLQRENLEIVRSSTVLMQQIADESSLQQGMQRLLDQGYTVAYDRRYLALPNGTEQQAIQLQDLAEGAVTVEAFSTSETIVTALQATGE